MDAETLLGIHVLISLRLFSVGDWVECTSNHFWWCLSTAKENPQSLVERFQSIIYHVINKHHWPGCTYFKKCAHDKLDNTADRKVKWMKVESVAYEAFKKIILHINVRKDLQQMAGGVHTTLLEVNIWKFHLIFRLLFL